MTSTLAILAKHWRVMAAVGLVLVLTWGWQSMRVLRAENARLVSEAAQAEAVIAGMRSALDDNRRALEAREAENARLAADHRSALAELEKVYETDEKACDWAGGDVPDGVLKLLCQ